MVEHLAKARGNPPIRRTPGIDKNTRLRAVLFSHNEKPRPSIWTESEPSRNYIVSQQRDYGRLFCTAPAAQ
jgi:hypothetical protein